MRNRVSETSTPQRGQSPRGRPKTPPEPQRQFKQLKVYDETPSGRPLPNLQQIRQGNLQKIFKEEGVDMPCDICGDPHHDYRNCTKEAYRESQDVRQIPVSERALGGQCPNCDIPHPGVCPCAWCGTMGPMGPVGPRGFPGRDGLSTTGGPFTSTGLGIPPVFNANLSTIGMENSLHYLGESLNHVMQFQQNVNWNMVEHLNMTVKNQQLQGQALGQLVENTRQREFDKLFDSIPVYDGEDPEKFEPWLSKLESACLVGKRDVREVAICSSTGPVLEVLNSIEDKEDSATHRDELHCCFSTNKTRVHAADLLSNFWCQHANENLRSFIHQYTKMHRQATGLKPEDDYDLSRKVEFMKRI